MQFEILIFVFVSSSIFKFNSSISQIYKNKFLMRFIFCANL